MATDLDPRLEVLCKRLTENVMGAALCANEIVALMHEIAPSCGTRRGEDGSGMARFCVHRPLLDESTLSVVWRGNVLPLGHTQGFWLLARLTQSANQYVTHVDLLQSVWDDKFIGPATLRAGVRRLRQKLRAGGMGDLADAIVGHHGRYMLSLASTSRHANVTAMSH